MRWFSGSITEAVVTSKSKGAVFVVFVEGSDDASKSTAEAIETQEVSASLESSDFVAIKLGSGTEEYKQFTEIYRIVPIPSIFFIGGDGRPIEIVAGASTPTQISQRINTVLEKTKDGQSGPIPAPKKDDLQKAASADGAGASAIGASTSSQTVTEGSAPEGSVSGGESRALAADRVEAARVLLEKTRALRQAEEKAREREQEEDRRRVGREVQELRRWQQDQEMRQLREEREREKREDAAARDKVKRQIEADKAERARKSREASGLAEPASAGPAPPVVTPTASNSDSARLQLRLPDGGVAVTTLPATATLSALREFAAGACGRRPAHFTLSTAFPRRELGSALDSQTLAQLELTPTAVVLVLPVTSGGVAQSSAANGVGQLTALFWSLLAPVLSVAAYLRSWLGGGASGGGNQSGVRRQSVGGGGGGQSVGGRAQGASPPGRREPPAAQVRRQGNVHRLTTARDSSDDETNTWNGNSTQQITRNRGSK